MICCTHNCSVVHTNQPNSNGKATALLIESVKIAAANPNQDLLQSVKMLQRRIERRNDNEKGETTVSILHVVLYYCV